MSISRLNAERYPDPTAYAALTRIEQEEKKQRTYRPIVYICSPYAGNVARNVQAARKYSRFAVDSGYLPVTPHLLYPQFLNDDDPKERNLGLFFGNVLLSKCRELWVFGETLTCGMEDEIEQARRKHIRIRYFRSNLKEVRS